MKARTAESSPGPPAPALLPEEHSAHATLEHGASSAKEKARPASPSSTSGAASPPASAMEGRETLRRSLQQQQEQQEEEEEGGEEGGEEQRIHGDVQAGGPGAPTHSSVSRMPRARSTPQAPRTSDFPQAISSAGRWVTTAGEVKSSYSRLQGVGVSGRAQRQAHSLALLNRLQNGRGWRATGRRSQQSLPEE